MPQSNRQDEILSWLAQQGLEVDNLIELPGDVSLRRYVRLESSGETLILAVYPPEIRSACRNFYTTTRLLAQAGVRVPRILANDCEHGLSLLEDVGSETLYDRRESLASDLSSYFWRGAADLERIQTLSTTEVALLNPSLDQDLLWRELQQTWNCLFEPHGLVTDREFARDLEAVLEEICRLLGGETPVPCHRDFMSRNLIPLEPFPELAVLDHQDLRLGPSHYDLASLLNDSLFPSEELEEEILQYCLENDPVERMKYHRAAAQRTLKATGTYETFAQRGFGRHRRLIPETLKRTLQHLRYLPESIDLHTDLENRMRSSLIC